MKINFFLRSLICFFILFVLQAMPFLGLVMFNFILWGLLSLSLYLPWRWLILYAAAAGMAEDIFSNTLGAWVLIYLVFCLSFKKVLSYFEISPVQVVFFVWVWVFLYVLGMYFFLNSAGFSFSQFILVFIENAAGASLIFYIIQKWIGRLKN